jgi:protein-tyrosine phosphatase
MRFSCAPTFRDVASEGLRRSDGRGLRAGLVYRGGHLLEPSSRELDVVRALGLRQVFDLRSGIERQHQPSHWLIGTRDGAVPQALHVDVNAAGRGEMPAGHAAAALRQLFEGGGVDGAQRMMRHTYRRFPQGFQAQLSTLFDALLDGERLPLLIHCTAGKDRTGFACAMLLFALGFSEETVFEDYLSTGKVLVDTPLADVLGESFGTLLGRPLEAAALEVIMSVDPAYLEIALAEVRSSYGSVDAYLAQAGGLDEARRQRLQTLLLD